MDTAVIQLTCRCPLDCEQCYMKKRNQEMSFSLAVDTINKARLRGVKALQLTGGEPLLYTRLDEIISYCHSLGLHTAIATSGFGHSISRYTALFDNGLSEICISINSIVEQENILTRDGYNLSIGAIQDVISLHLPFAVNIVVSKHNIETLRSTIEKLIEMGCQEICLLKRFPSICGEKVDPLTKNDIRNICSVVDEYSGIVNVEDCFLEYWFCKKKTIYSCRDAGMASYFINVEGTFSPCSQTTRFAYKNFADMITNADQWRRGYCYAKDE